MFSLWRHGPVERALRRLGLVRGDGADVARLTLTSGAIGLVPLVALAVLTGDFDLRLVGPLALVRWLVALPMLFGSLQLIDTEVRASIEHLCDAGIAPEPVHAEVVEAQRRVEAALDSRRLFVALVAAVALLSFGPLLRGPAIDSPLRGWHVVVAMPILRYAMLSWAVAWLAWAWLVARLARLPLVLSVSHPDGRAGLAELGRPLRGFAIAVFGLGSIVATSVWSDLTFELRDLVRLAPPLVAYGVGAVLLASVPGWFLVRPLYRAKRRALRRWGALAASQTAAFEARWLGRPGDPILEVQDPSSVTDLGSTFQTVVQTEFSPLTKRELLLVVLVSALPLLPVAFTVLPASEVARLLLGFLG